jgi:ribosomal protein S18 acetylase RimI-like enzyme
MRISMILTIIKGKSEHLPACVQALRNSRLGEQYFPTNEKAVAAISEGMTKDEFYVAMDEERRCLGFIWYIFSGAFHAFPYLHIIAVSESARGLGIGKQLMDFFERQVFADHSKVFLVVADFNPDARRLYERLGYRQVGAIPGLYKDGVTEYLMMKVKDSALEKDELEQTA